MRKFLVFATLLSVGAGVLVWGAGQGWFDVERKQASIAEKQDAEAPIKVISVEQSKAELAELLGVNKDDFSDVGGISRPNRDLNYENAITRTKEPIKSVLPNPGRAPYLKGNENPQVAGLMSEITNQDETKQTDTRAAKSTFFLPEPFDQKKYDADPQTYLSQIRPGRVFQPAQPSADVKRLTAVSDPFVRLLQGESVQLQVKANPGAPVAFHTPETGTFGNQLKSITVAANDEGIAAAKFTLGRGTSGLVNVLAASPVHSDQVKFTFKVLLPNQQ